MNEFQFWIQLILDIYKAKIIRSKMKKIINVLKKKSDKFLKQIYNNQTQWISNQNLTNKIW